jgi:hypothetical protein
VWQLAECGARSVLFCVATAITDFAWIALLFPFWALLVSTYILATDIHG